MHATQGSGYAGCVRQRARSLSGIGAGSYFVCPPAHTQRRVDELRRTASRKNSVSWCIGCRQSSWGQVTPQPFHGACAAVPVAIETCRETRSASLQILPILSFLPILPIPREWSSSVRLSFVDHSANADMQVGEMVEVYRYAGDRAMKGTRRIAYRPRRIDDTMRTGRVRKVTWRCGEDSLADGTGTLGYASCAAQPRAVPRHRPRGSCPPTADR